MTRAAGAQASKTAMHWAAQYALPSEDLAELAKLTGAVNDKDDSGHTPLMLAAMGHSPAHLCGPNLTAVG